MPAAGAEGWIVGEGVDLAGVHAGLAIECGKRFDRGWFGAFDVAADLLPGLAFTRGFAEQVDEEFDLSAVAADERQIVVDGARAVRALVKIGRTAAADGVFDLGDRITFAETGGDGTFADGEQLRGRMVHGCLPEFEDLGGLGFKVLFGHFPFNKAFWAAGLIQRHSTRFLPPSALVARSTHFQSE